MRCLLVLGSLLVISVTYSFPSPCECHTDRGPVIVTDAPPVIQSPPDKVPAGTRTETISNVSRNSSQTKNSLKTKNTEKVKTKERADGSIVTIIIDKHKTKNKTKELTDSYDQTNRTIKEGGVETQDSWTHEKERQAKDVKIQKNVTKEIKITAKNGTVLLDKFKTKTSEKERKSEKTKELETSIHTVKKMTTEAPHCITVPPKPPCDKTTCPPRTNLAPKNRPSTYPLPTPPCDIKTVPPPTNLPPKPPCGTMTTPPPTPPCETTTTSPPTPPCETTTTTESPRLPCGCKRTTTTTEKPETWPCGHPKPIYYEYE